MTAFAEPASMMVQSLVQRQGGCLSMQPSHRRRQQGHHSRRRAQASCCAARTGGRHQDADVVVVGAGIIGLCIAHRLLQSTKLSVTVVDRKQPCAGATGAGQGYIWMCHRQPLSPGWELAQHSKRIWEHMAANAELAKAMEWQANGSVLLATTPAEVEQLEARAAMLTEQGIMGVRLLSRDAMLREEPALALPLGSAGLMVESDAQINGKATAFALLHECKRIGAGGRFQALLDEPVEQVVPGTCASGAAVQTSCAPVVLTAARRLRAKRAVIVAAGVWSGAVLCATTGQESWTHLLQPRRGHLLELQHADSLPVLQHGIMELSYTRHYNHSSHSSTADNEVDITFTATTSASGSLLLGSSREFDGWASNAKESVVDAIWERARLFLPGIPASSDAHARVGLRPYAVGGLPCVGPVEGAPGVFVAAGHEGSGLCMGPATAELVLSYALDPDVYEGRAPFPAAVELLPSERLKASGHLVAQA